MPTEAWRSAVAKPRDLRIEQPIKFELIINLQTAKALGLTIPRSIYRNDDERPGEGLRRQPYWRTTLS
jgi:hypothetical protein